LTHDAAKGFEHFKLCLLVIQQQVIFVLCVLVEGVQTRLVLATLAAQQLVCCMHPVVPGRRVMTALLIPPLQKFTQLAEVFTGIRYCFGEIINLVLKTAVSDQPARFLLENVGALVPLWYVLLAPFEDFVLLLLIE